MVLIVCGFVEMMWFGFVWGVCVEMLVGLLGLGDFVLICLLISLCNFLFGVGFGCGELVCDLFVDCWMVVEGVFIVLVLCEVVCEVGVDMLIIEVVCCLFEGVSVGDVIGDLFVWFLKGEVG